MRFKSQRSRLLNIILLAALTFNIPSFFFLRLQFSQDSSAGLFFPIQIATLALVAWVAYHRPLQRKVIDLGLIISACILFIVTIIGRSLAPESTTFLQLIAQIATETIAGFGLLVIGMALSDLSPQEAREEIVLGFGCASLVLLAFKTLSPFADAQLQQIFTYLFLGFIFLFMFLARRSKRAFAPVKEVVGKQGWFSILSKPQRTPLITFSATVLIYFFFGLFEAYARQEGPVASLLNLTMAILIGLCLLSYIVLRRKRSRGWFNSLVLVICIAYILIFFVTLMMADLTPMLFSVLAIGLVVLHVPLWVFLTDKAIERSISPLFLYGLFPAILAVAQLFGRLLSWLLLSLPGLGASKIAAVTLAVTAIAAVVALAFMLRARETRRAITTGESSGQLHKSEMLETFCSQYGLTEREHDIIRHYSEGRSVPFISSTLYISKSTVKTHIGKVYAKLGIHSKQELLDMLYAAQDQTERES